MLKLFEISVDNDPGGWKSGGGDATYLVIAESEEESKEKFQKSYGSEWRYHDNGYDKMPKVYGYKENLGGEFSKTYIARGARISSIEIQFEGFDMIFSNRETKINKLLENGKENGDN